MIVTVTLNAAVDRTLTVPNFQFGHRHRASSSLTSAGGKGVNVARALKLAFGARKVNYALFGNVVPHIHWHLIPRLETDPAPHDPVFAVPHAPVTLARVERAARILKIRARLGR